jgi:hypothetical protein
MKGITDKVFSFCQKAGGKYSVSEIAQTKPRAVRTYAELRELTAEIGYRNRRFFPLFRAQDQEHYRKTKIGQKGKRTKIIAAFYRPCEGKFKVDTPEKQERLEKMTADKAALMEEINRKNNKLFNKTDFGYFDELAWSLFQHYELRDTPLLDLTQSLHVACSMARYKNKTQKAVLYVLGFEELSSTVSYSYNNHSLLIRLAGVMPKTAKRPLYQEGFLAGNFPNTSEKALFKDFDFSNRLLAKFSFDPFSKEFWNDGFKPLPQRALFPTDDMMGDFLREVVSRKE